MVTQVDMVKELRDKFTLYRDYTAGDYAERHPERHLGMKMTASFLDKVYQEKEAGRQQAWINYAVASELLVAMDLTPVFLDGFGGLTAQTPEVAIDYINKAEAEIPDYICAVNKIFLGMMLSGDIPTPGMLIVPSHTCDSNLATYPVIAEQYGFPYFCIDAPYLRDERGLEHVVSELKRLIAFLEEHTGRKLEYEKLKQVMEHSNRAHEYILKIAELSQSVPAPVFGQDVMMDYMVILSLGGTPELTDYMEQKYHILKEKVEKQEGQPSNEKLRLVWIYGSPVFDPSIFGYLEKKYGAHSIANMNNNFTMEPVEDLSSTDSILKGIASKIINLPMGRECGGPWENYVTAMIDLCKRYQGDAAIFAGHVACKANWPIMKLVKDRIQEELGIPTLIFGLDLMDPRVTSMDTIKGQFDDFLGIHFPEVVGD